MEHKKFLRKQGAKGGKAGKGGAKKRGDSNYYRKLANRRAYNAKVKRKKKLL